MKGILKRNDYPSEEARNLKTCPVCKDQWWEYDPNRATNDRTKKTCPNGCQSK